jgi:hypothetical protein
MTSIVSNQSFDPNLRDILLSQILTSQNREQLNGDNQTLVRVHLIPYPPSMIHRNVLNIRETLNNGYSPVILECNSNNLARKRNQHVAHLPKYQKVNETTLKKFSDELCSICHEGFYIGEYYRTLPICNHTFHKKCVDKWLRKDIMNMRCPLCRVSHNPQKWQCWRETNDCFDPL